MLQNSSDLETSIENRRNALKKAGLTLQPMPVFLGPITKIESSYVLIDNTLYSCDSVIEAVQSTFHAFYALDATYPTEAANIWKFIQHFFFQIKNTTNKPPGIKLLSVINDFSNPITILFFITMNICSSCKHNCLSNTELIKHVKNNHPFLNAYKCEGEECSRVFGSFRCFQKHRLGNYHVDKLIETIENRDVNSSRNLILDNSINSTPISINADVDASINYNIDNDSLDNDLICDNDDSSDSDDLISSENFQIFDQFFLSSMEKEIVPSHILNDDVTECLAYFYAMKNLPRKRVTQIIEVFSEFLNSDRFETLQNNVLCRLKQLGESNKNLEHFKKEFEFYKNPFRDCNTEYLIFKRFVQSENLILPESVVIGSGREFKLIDN